MGQVRVTSDECVTDVVVSHVLSATRRTSTTESRGMVAPRQVVAMRASNRDADVFGCHSGTRHSWSADAETATPALAPIVLPLATNRTTNSRLSAATGGRPARVAGSRSGCQSGTSASGHQSRSGSRRAHSSGKGSVEGGCDASIELSHTTPLELRARHAVALPDLEVYILAAALPLFLVALFGLFRWRYLRVVDRRSPLTCGCRS